MIELIDSASDSRWIATVNGTPVAEVYEPSMKHYDIYLFDGVRQWYVESFEEIIPAIAEGLKLFCTEMLEGLK